MTCRELEGSRHQPEFPGPRDSSVTAPRGLPAAVRSSDRRHPRLAPESHERTTEHPRISLRRCPVGISKRLSTALSLWGETATCQQHCLPNLRFCCDPRVSARISTMHYLTRTWGKTEPGNAFICIATHLRGEKQPAVCLPSPSKVPMHTMHNLHASRPLSAARSAAVLPRWSWPFINRRCPTFPNLWCLGEWKGGLPSRPRSLACPARPLEKQASQAGTLAAQRPPSCAISLSN